jgi:hypothetical protein
VRVGLRPGERSFECREDAKLTVGELVDQRRSAGGVATGFELARNRDDVAVADATYLDDLYETSAYTQISGGRRGGDSR